MKLRNKLFMSIAATAAAAATLGTSTFAWYVSNPTVTASGFGGSADASGTAGSLSISLSAAAGSWKKSIALSKSAVQMIPVHYVADSKKFFTLKDDNDITKNTTVGLNTTETAVGACAISTTFYLKADAAGTASFSKITIKNTTAKNSYQTQVNYGATPLTAGATTITEGKSFQQDAIHALYMAVNTYDWKSGDGTLNEAGTAYATPYGFETTSTTTLFACDAEGFTYTNENNADLPVVTGAHTYYKDITGDTVGEDANTAPVTTALSSYSVNLAAGKPIQVELLFWIEGADLECFNACAGQSFTFDFEYSFNVAK